MVKRDEDGDGLEGLDGLAGTPVGKFLKMARERDAREAEETRARIEDLMKRLGVGDGGERRNEAVETPKRETLSRAEIMQVVKAAQHDPHVRATLKKAAAVGGGEKVGPGDPAKRAQEAGPGESMAEALEKAGYKALARLLRRPMK